MKANNVLFCLLVGLLAATVFVDCWLFSRKSSSSRSSNSGSKSSSGGAKSSNGGAKSSNGWFFSRKGGSSKNSHGGSKSSDDNTKSSNGGAKSSNDGAKNSNDGAKSSISDAKNSNGGPIEYVKDFVGGASDMWRNYKDMKDAYSDLKDAGLDATGNDKYFHAKANYEAANRGPGGKHASAIISNIREGLNLVDKANYDVRKPKVTDWNAIWADYKADQEANRHGRNGGDPTVFRPEGLPEQYGLKNTD